MVNIDNLKSRDEGRGVFYKDFAGKRTFGLIKSWNDKWIFVVYNCSDDWKNYENYTAAATDSKDLKFEALKPGEDDIETRFEILDL